MPSMESMVGNPLLLIFVGFVIWMLVDAIRRSEWLWVVFIIIFPVLNAPLYFFLVYRNAVGAVAVNFEIPGARQRKRIEELESQIELLDKAHHYLELGDIYSEQGKKDRALVCYQSAAERDPEDLDIRGHLGRCLLELKRPGEARVLLESVCLENPKHEYGYSMMALAEAYAAQGDQDSAIATLERVLLENSYPQARVQLAELYLAKQRTQEAERELREVVKDDSGAPDFQRKRDRVWVRRARQLLG
ncbi:MAG: tetratricopeptide repeat protein [Verrucomicrobia bacterium]|nr:tetratricopeptide repeat protein [Verrucomicrobiota bacterium]